MTTPQGYATHLLLKRQTAFGTAAGSNYYKMPFHGTGFGKKHPYEASKRAGQGRDPEELERGDIDVSGDFRVPVDCRYIGHWLTGLLGNPDTTGGEEEPYTHIFKTGKTTAPPVFSAEVGHLNPANFERSRDVHIAGATFSFSPKSGNAEAVFRGIGADGASYATTQGGTPQLLTYLPASNYKARIKKDGSAVGAIMAATLTIDNATDAYRHINSDGEMSGFDPGESAIGLNFTWRYTDRSFVTLAEAGTPVKFELGFDVATDLTLWFAIHEALLEPTSSEISGPGIYMRDYVAKPRKNTSEGCILTAELVNDVEGTVYTTGS